MKYLYSLIAFFLCIGNSAIAEELPAFPTMNQVIGGMKLPQSDGSPLNPKFENEVLRKYKFDDTWQAMIVGAIRVELVRARSEVCGDRIGSETDFALAVFAHRKYDSELTALVKKTDATKKVRTYFSYQSIPTPDQYKQLAEIPSNDLSKQFVVGWLASGYLEKSHNTIVELAKGFLRVKCDS